MPTQIDSNLTFSGIDPSKLGPILQKYNIPQTEINKILSEPSLYIVSDIIKSPEGQKEMAEIIPPKTGVTAPIQEQNISAFEQLFAMIISLQSDMSKLQALLNKLGLDTNLQALQTTKQGNEKVADSERNNAIAQVIGGVVSGGVSGMTMKVSFNGGRLPAFFSKTGVNAESAPRTLGEGGMQAMNSMGSGLGEFGKGITGIVAADQSKDGKNLVAYADFQKTTAAALSEAVSNMRNQIENQQGAAGVITSFIQSVSRN